MVGDDLRRTRRKNECGNGGGGGWCWVSLVVVVRGGHVGDCLVVGERMTA
jgi:hypothetical protein